MTASLILPRTLTEIITTLEGGILSVTQPHHKISLISRDNQVCHVQVIELPGSWSKDTVL